MARKKLEDAISHLESLLPSEDRKYGELIMRILASLPGGDEAEDLGFEPFPFLGWLEVSMLGDLLDAIQDKTDVEETVHRLLGGDEEEAQKNPRSRWPMPGKPGRVPPQIYSLMKGINRAVGLKVMAPKVLGYNREHKVVWLESHDNLDPLHIEEYETRLREAGYAVEWD